MSQKCSQCGAILSSYNTGEVCFPCQKKRKDVIVEKLTSSRYERPEYLDRLLGSKLVDKAGDFPPSKTEPSGLYFQSAGPGSTRSRGGDIEIDEERILDWKPRVHISLNPLACSRGRSNGVTPRRKMI
jgi:hypothetical protein